MKRNLLLVVMVGLMMACGLAYAGKPVKNISKNRHPNLAAAQRLTDQAFDKIVQAQRANEYDLGGHAQKAKELLESASRELKLAAQAANEDNKRAK